MTSGICSLPAPSQVSRAINKEVHDEEIMEGWEKCWETKEILELELTIEATSNSVQIERMVTEAMAIQNSADEGE